MLERNATCAQPWTSRDHSPWTCKQQDKHIRILVFSKLKHNQQKEKEILEKVNDITYLYCAWLSTTHSQNPEGIKHMQPTKKCHFGSL